MSGVFLQIGKADTRLLSPVFRDKPRKPGDSDPSRPACCSVSLLLARVEEQTS